MKYLFLMLIMGLTTIAEEAEKISSMKKGIMTAGAMMMITEGTAGKMENGAHLNASKY